MPWVRKNIPKTAIFYCDPFGRSDPDSILCRGLPNAVDEENAVFLFDQEPVQTNLHIPTFQSFKRRTNNLHPSRRVLITSETDSDNVDYICKFFNLRPFYYFFHGWASLDWYRGYNRTFLIKDPALREITTTFISPNRIIGGDRSHRVAMLYYMQRKNLMHNFISAPKICPVENQPIDEIARQFEPAWPDILETISDMDLPRLFPEEYVQKMSSCWLDQFELCEKSLFYHVSETVYFGRRSHLTEKTFKPIALGMPFVLTAPAHSLQYLKRYGFKTFDSVWDEGYDSVISDEHRISAIAELMKDLDRRSIQEKNELFQQCLPIIKHNWDHFYNGGFETVLWQELETMLSDLKVYYENDLPSN